MSHAIETLKAESARIYDLLKVTKINSDEYAKLNRNLNQVEAAIMLLQELLKWAYREKP